MNMSTQVKVFGNIKLTLLQPTRVKAKESNAGQV